MSAISANGLSSFLSDNEQQYFHGLLYKLCTNRKQVMSAFAYSHQFCIYMRKQVQEWKGRRARLHWTSGKVMILNLEGFSDMVCIDCLKFPQNIYSVVEFRLLWVYHLTIQNGLATSAQ
jgi:hypothetical protein